MESDALALEVGANDACKHPTSHGRRFDLELEEVMGESSDENECGRLLAAGASLLFPVLVRLRRAESG